MAAFRHDCAIKLALFLLVWSMSVANSPTLAEHPADLPAGARSQVPAAGARGYSRPTEAQKLTSCMELWEPETHMSKALWKTVCKRIQTNN
jgi:hypothetical protein